MTGNGAFDGVSQWGESFIKIRYTPPSGATAASLKVVDHWTPWTDEARSGAANAPPAPQLAASQLPDQLDPASLTIGQLMGWMVSPWLSGVGTQIRITSACTSAPAYWRRAG